MESGAAPKKSSEGQQYFPAPAVAVDRYMGTRLATYRECKLLETYLNGRYGDQTERSLSHYAKEQLSKSLRRAA